MRLLGLIVLCAWAVACGPPHSVDRAIALTASDAGRRDAPRGPSVDRRGAAEGARCESSSDCRSGYCTDGVCCDTACNGACTACDVGEFPGRCLPVPNGQDPGNDCSEEPAATCGRDGMCDGAGSCRRYPAGAECGPGGCKDATQTAASTCDGAGKCQPGATKSCAPAVCTDDTCGDPCTVDGDCKMTGFFCDSGTCRPTRAQAAACDRDAQCSTGHCADKVCCATACTDKCYTCSASGMVGSCVPTRENGDPRRECPVMGIQTCGNAGGCNGRGACRLHVPGTPCGFGTCSGSTLVGPSSCDGMGGCKPGPKRDCDPYVCNGDGCWTACATNDQCKSGRTCRINACR